MSGLMHHLKQELHKKYNPIVPNFRAGDTLKVYVPMMSKGKEIQKIFEGFCVKKGKASFSVRKNSGDEAIEIRYSYLTPSKVDILAHGKVRRAKLYYMRDLRGKKARIKRDYGRSFPKSA
jgi:large subunit ribosomal protein L19